jgi:iron complex outermembrane receptor protein
MRQSSKRGRSREASAPVIPAKVGTGRGLRNGVLTGLAILVPVSVMAQEAGQEGQVEEVIVTGFRSSLEQALDIKRESASAVDAIYAEDMAKFPDLNLSESIQRIPGVSISRDAGEGRNISVRGLGGQFTRVRINGMEALTTSGGTDAAGGTNRGRGFDFNVFASDLFNRITVQKTSAADTEEGSLGATVDLHTARPLDREGFNLAFSAKEGYNDLADEASPRAAALISNTWADGKLGALFSIAYSKRELLDQGTSTVRWQTGTATAPGFRSVNGTTCAGNAAACAEANGAVHPRIPRFDKYEDDQERIGATGSFQWAPTDKTLVSLDLLYADFKGERDESFLETFTPQTAGACTAASPPSCGLNQTDVLSYRIDTRRAGLPIMIAGTFNNIDLKTEQRHDELETKFRQATLEGAHTFSDQWQVHGALGYSKSEFGNPVQTTVQWDQFNVQNYSYDYGVGRYPLLTYGSGNVGDANGWVLSEIRQAPNFVDNDYRTGQFDTTFTLNDSVQLQGGIQYKKYETEATAFSRSNGTTANVNANSPASVRSVPLASYGELIRFSGVDIPAGNVGAWISPDVNAAVSALSLYDRGLATAVTSTPNVVWRSPFATTCFTTGCGVFNVGREPVLGNNYTITEEDSSGFFQTNFSFDIGGVPVRGDVGVRYVKTDQESLGFGLVTTTQGATTFQTITPTSSSRSYNDTLPAMNVVIEATHDLLFRIGAAKVMARPDLNALRPGITINTAGNKTVTSGNPNIDPFRAKTYDGAVEWYFAPGALLSGAYFYKDINTFVQTVTSAPSVFSANPFGLPDSAAVAACGTLQGCAPELAIWQFNAPLNTPGGPLKGYELNYQQPFTFLPEPFDKFGLLANYTHVTSDVKYLGAGNVVTAIGPLTNLSKDAYNATIYFENDKFSARVSSAFRSKYLTMIPGRNGSDVEGTNETLNVDFSATYTFNDSLSFTLEAVNLTNEVQDQYYDSSNLVSFYHETGREYFIGFRYTL